MRRFVYQPQIKAYIYSSEYNQTYDISDDIVGGQVVRRLEALSEATLVLQNKYGRYTAGANIKPGKNTRGILLNPMDTIRIYSSRVGDPFPIFTGYLDEVPLIQQYPNTVTIKASCTLKLIKYTFFDPGLPFMTNWFQQFGLVYNFNTGVVIDPAANLGNFDFNGGLGQIIYRAMVDIGRWNAKSGLKVHVKKVPTKFINKLNAYWNADISEVDQQLTRTRNRFASLFSENDVTGGGTSATSTDCYGNALGPSTPPTGNLTPQDVAKLALQVGFSKDAAAIMVAIAIHESSLVTWIGNRQGSGATGLWQIAPLVNGHLTFDGTGTRDETYTGPVGSAFAGQTTSIHGVNGARDQNGNFVMTAYQDPLNNAKAAFVISNNGTEFFTSSTWSTDNQLSDYAGNLQTGQAAVAAVIASAAGGTSTQTPNCNTYDSSSSSSDSNKGQTLLGVAQKEVGNTNGNKYDVSVGAPVGSAWSASFVYWCFDQIGSSRDAVKSSNVSDWVNSSLDNKSIVTIPKPGWLIYRYPSKDPKIGIVSQVNKDGSFNVIIGDSSGKVASAPSSDFSDYNGFLVTSIDSSQVGTPTAPVAGSNAGSGGYSSTGGGTGGFSSSQTVTAADASALAFRTGFFTQQLTSNDSTLALLLTGQRALSNTIPLLQWINDLTKGAGRTYCSGPNGDFYSFFPDYFGWFVTDKSDTGTPYFKITDIETKKLEVQVTDESLVTHVFGIGPLLGLDISILNELASIVASVEEPAFTTFIDIVDDLHKVNDPTAYTAKKFNPVVFLEKYGARPFNAEFSNIRHPLILWMATWREFSLMWANRFIADAEFTFMPELFPGGLVNLDDVCQMFIQQVTHNFDLQNGFTTSAELVALAGVPGSPKSALSNVSVDTRRGPTLA